MSALPANTAHREQASCRTSEVIRSFKPHQHCVHRNSPVSPMPESSAFHPSADKKLTARNEVHIGELKAHRTS